MSRECKLCGKKPMVGNNVSHAHNVTKRRFNPNLQRVRALHEGQVKKIDVCTSCIKAGSVVKAPRAASENNGLGHNIAHSSHLAGQRGRALGP